MSDLSVDVTHLSLFPQPNEDVEKRLLNADLVWVGGGSVANLLAVWKLHKVDEVLKTAYENGTVLSGVSAGSICWFIGGTTDSFGPELKPVNNGLALLPYANGVHYDSEAQRRPLLQSLIKDGTFETAFATDDHTGIIFKGIEPIEVISDVKSDPQTGPAAYKLEKINGEVQEVRLAVGTIS
jgi:cyanophycinase-like exopeptidase